MRYRIIPVLGIACSLATFMATGCTQKPRYPAPAVAGAHVAMALGDLPIDAPVFYSHPVGRKHVDFFVIRHEKAVLSFLDACVNCYRNKMGYAYHNGFVICRACDTKYSIYKLDKGLGGCYPIQIDGRIENNKYLIPLALLESAVDKF